MRGNICEIDAEKSPESNGINDKTNWRHFKMAFQNNNNKKKIACRQEKKNQYLSVSPEINS